MFDVIKRSVINRLSLRTRVGTLSIPGALLEGFSAKGSILEFVDFPTDAKKLLKSSAKVLSSLLYTFAVTDL